MIKLFLDEHSKDIENVFTDIDAHKRLVGLSTKALNDYVRRHSFMRRILQRGEENPGEPSVLVKVGDKACVAMSDTEFQVVDIEKPILRPKEFCFQDRFFLEKNRKVQPAVPEEYNRLIEKTLCAEDRLFFNMVSALEEHSHINKRIHKVVDPLSLMALRNSVYVMNIKPSAWVFAESEWEGIVANEGLVMAFEPVANHEDVLAGFMGHIFGMDAYTDAYRHPEHKVLQPGKTFIFGDSKAVGQYTDRGGYQSQAIDRGTQTGADGRGAFFSQSTTMVLKNAKAISFGNIE
jgi:hypothetical protein